MHPEQDSDTTRINGIFDVLEKWSNEGAVEPAYFTFAKLAQNDPSLKSELGIKRVLKTIEEKTAGGVTFDVRTGTQRLPDRAGQIGVYSDSSDPVSLGVEFFIADKNRLNTYRALSLKKESQHKTTLIPSEITIGKLSAGKDGHIRYGGQVINMRGQIVTLCWLFMQKQKRLVTRDDISEQIIAARKRAATSYSTIAKYVSELHAALMPFYRHEVIFNSKKDGWTFDPDKART